MLLLSIAKTVWKSSSSLSLRLILLFGTLVNLSSPNSAFTDPVSSLEEINVGVSGAEGSAAQGSAAPPATPAPEVPGEMEEVSSAVPWENGEKDQQPPQPVTQGGKLWVWRNRPCPPMRGMVVLAEEEQDSLVHWGGRNMPVSCLKKLL